MAGIAGLPSAVRVLQTVTLPCCRIVLGLLGKKSSRPAVIPPAAAGDGLLFWQFCSVPGWTDCATVAQVCGTIRRAGIWLIPEENCVCMNPAVMG
ncbi:hypothetical protein L1S32_08205 [Methanogenium sp. S4BF]|uniref:hypothetical protein n=1 Tax=Methanogenium sp. S4BF TaxID=1789226 RepID=UPI002415C290|nr:hypothetical protein [Methanogenium sp. S4BF]WFN33823.1 hypothetical protein L1S32_08205 [Methanogenium sp. S4BF]